MLQFMCDACGTPETTEGGVISDQRVEVTFQCPECGRCASVEISSEGAVISLQGPLCIAHTIEEESADTQREDS